MRKRALTYQWKILDYIVAFKVSHDGNSPTIREIGDALGWASTSQVCIYLDRMEILGMINREDFGKSRNISIPGGRWLPPPHLKANLTPQAQADQDAKKLLKILEVTEHR